MVYLPFTGYLMASKQQVYTEFICTRHKNKGRLWFHFHQGQKKKKIGTHSSALQQGQKQVSIDMTNRWPLFLGLGGGYHCVQDAVSIFLTQIDRVNKILNFNICYILGLILKTTCTNLSCKWKENQFKNLVALGGFQMQANLTIHQYNFLTINGYIFLIRHYFLLL